MRNEIENMKKWIDKKISNDEKKIDVLVPMKSSIANTITNFLLGKTFQYEDSEFKRYQVPKAYQVPGI